MNGLTKRIKRIAFGLRNFLHWRVRVLLYAGTPDWSKLPTIILTPLESDEPPWSLDSL